MYKCIVKLQGQTQDQRATQHDMIHFLNFQNREKILNIYL